MQILFNQKGSSMARAYKPKTRLDRLEFSPKFNPLAETAAVKTKTKFVRTGHAEHLADIKTGEITHTSLLHQVQHLDEEHFVKIFAAGVKAMFELSGTAMKVFNIVLENYQNEKMTGGYTDTVDLFWFDSGLSGYSFGISEDVFNRGLRELIDKRFLAPRMPNNYWVNANLFFKGDRVIFIKEYRKQSQPKRSKAEAVRDPRTVDLIADMTDEELSGKRLMSLADAELGGNDEC